MTKRKSTLFYLIIFYEIFLSLFFLGCSASEKINIIPRNEWNANLPAPFKIHNPVRITIHHEGEIFDPKKESSRNHIKKIQTWGMSSARYWSDIPYHFLIDFDGNIFEGRNVWTMGETATEYNPEGHLLITCLGNFEVQELTDSQFESLQNIIAYCCIKYQISPETINGHKDFANTLCPGKNLYKFLENGLILKKVKEKIIQLQIQ